MEWRHIHNNTNLHYSLAAVNFCLFCVGTIQVGRILTVKKVEDGSATAAVKDLASDVKGQAIAAKDSAKEKLA